MERTLTREEAELWATNLESGNFKQGQRALKRWSYDNSSQEYCCLGVLAEQCSIDSSSNSYIRDLRNGDSTLLPRQVQSALANKNDSGFSFREIAGIIREELIPVMFEQKIKIYDCRDGYAILDSARDSTLSEAFNTDEEAIAGVQGDIVSYGQSFIGGGASPQFCITLANSELPPHIVHGDNILPNLLDSTANG